MSPDAPVAVLLDGACRASGSLSLASISKRTARDLGRELAGRFLVVDARLGGLKDGLLNGGANAPVSTIEDGWGEGALEYPEEDRPDIRIRTVEADERRATAAFRAAMSDPWREIHAMPYRVSPEGETDIWVVVEKRCGSGAGEGGEAIGFETQRLHEHQTWAAGEATRIARALDLGEADQRMLAAAARRHDEGKRAPRWQRAFNASALDGPCARTPGPVDRHVLNGFRHELRSALDAERTGLHGMGLAEPRFDLVLHLIASLDGYARPTIATDGYDDIPPSAATARSQAIAARFARLQRQWGPWGLAWWEALLRAADASAARMVDEDSVHRRAAPSQPMGSPEPRPAAADPGMR